MLKYVCAEFEGSSYECIQNETSPILKSLTKCINMVVKDKTCLSWEYALDTDCILKEDKCDGDEQCPNGRDEHISVCTSSGKCDEDEFYCVESATKKQCNRFECSEFECMDDNKSNDASHCSNFKCMEYQCLDANITCQEFKCTNYRCTQYFESSLDNDGERTCKQFDCEDYSCLDPMCIPKSKVCDGIDDCSEGSDETDEVCGDSKCNDDEWTCRTPLPTGDHQCISLDQLCDGEIHCIDGSDENEDICRDDCGDDNTFSVV